MESLKDKVAIITGASSGIGEGVAVHLASLGCRLVLTGRTQEKLDRVIKKCRTAGCAEGNLVAISGDITTHATRMNVVEQAEVRWGRLDILINNSGIVCTTSLANVTKVDYDLTFDNNIRCHVLMTKACLPYLVKTKGCVINNSSAYSQTPNIDHGVYCMTKAAMDMFTKCLALEMGPKGVRVNSINPGLIATNMYRKKEVKMKDDAFFQKYLEENAAQTPLGRTGLPHDCAQAVAFLASDASSFISGETLFVDGARSLVSVNDAKPKAEETMETS
ncbi:uncharacterized oxidoreductase MexAM1_META1p0182-like [Mya arenaria]|uniref:uncharacterized oxidoreductase MexAM1_META1p0182-like n=1 Tax=Mya arenaria TaxID=6604 RepID=UPI0022E6C53A|nr:uncharacterized oxidoreductase MexAM1_META1p0182-like [Mya arenaria]